MSAQDQNKKTLRHFQCRDYLWDVFEQMSAELECSTDYLINEAMRQYARSRNYAVGHGSNPPAEAAAESPAPAPPAPAARAIPSLRPSAPGRATIPAPPRRGGGPTRPQLPSAPVAVAPAMPRRPSSMPPPPPRTSQPGPGRPRSGPQAAMPAAGPAPRQSRPSLFVIFNGQKIPINKDEWVIGRGQKSADLPIRDGNISRRHAAVVFQNGAYYLKDLGSTNGMEYQGRRFDSKRIEEGDIIRVCDYEMRFTFQ